MTPGKPRVPFQRAPELRTRQRVCKNHYMQDNDETGSFLSRLVRSQLNPVKTIQQLARDRSLFRTFILAVLVLSFCG